MLKNFMLHKNLKEVENTLFILNFHSQLQLKL